MLSGPPDQNELSISEWTQLIDEFAYLGGKNITFSGGELLIKRGWGDLIKIAHGNGISSTILTNGTLWTRHAIREMAPYIAEIQISVDGPSEYINSQVRGEGNFIKSITTAREFVAAGVRTSIAMTPTLQTIGAFDRHFQDFFSEHIYGSGINLKISQKLLSGRQGSKPIGDSEKKYQAITSSLANVVYPLSGMRAFFLGHLPNQTHRNCGFGGISISASGDAYPCNRIADVRSCGNVRSMKLPQLFAALDVLERTTSVDNIVPCRSCDLRYVCGGGCRIDDYYILNGTTDLPMQPFGGYLENGDTITKINVTDECKEMLLKKMVDAKEYWFVPQ